MRRPPHDRIQRESPLLSRPQFGVLNVNHFFFCLQKKRKWGCVSGEYGTGGGMGMRTHPLGKSRPRTSPSPLTDTQHEDEVPELRQRSNRLRSPTDIAAQQNHEPIFEHKCRTGVSRRFYPLLAVSAFIFLQTGQRKSFLTTNLDIKTSVDTKTVRICRGNKLLQTKSIFHRQKLKVGVNVCMLKLKKKQKKVGKFKLHKSSVRH